MQNANIALISTLYNSKGADFYKDIYFPIIKYAAMNIFYEYDDSQRYYDIVGLQECITNKIGITIPIPVLRNSIRALSRRPNQDVVLELYQSGDYFVIRKNWDADTNENLEQQADEISANFRELNLYFKEFLSIEHLTSNKEFVDFFLAYASDVSNYINSSDTASNVNEDYVNIVRYIQWLRESKPQSYQVVNNLMWGSIVAGFLQRQKVETDIRVIDKVDYYLDTSLVLSMLNLDSEENIIYAKDLLRIIKESGSIPYVHALTVREISRILSSVEAAQGPKPGSSIEHAWASQGLSLSSLLHIRNNLEKILQEDLGISIKMSTSANLDEIERKYKNNFDVKALAEERKSIGEDKVREVHDVYMKDYVQKINLDRGGAFIENQTAYFVSLNSDLIKFASKAGVIPSIIHASKVIMNLWIHSSRSENVQKEVLAEVMSRCFALNQTDVRHRLNIFQKYYKDCSLTKEDVSQMYTSLIKRSANTINEFDKLSQLEESEQENKDAICKEIIQGVVAAVNKESQQRNAETQSMQLGIETLNQKVAEMSKIIDDANYLKMQHKSMIDTYKQGESLSNETIHRLEEEIKTKTRLLEIESLISRHKDEMHPLSEQRKRCPKFFKFWFILSFECLGICAFIVFTILYLLHWNREKIWNVFSFGSIVTLFGLAARFKNLYLLSPGITKMKLRKEQEEFWDSKHPEYTELKNKISDLELEKKSLQQI